ncbi:transporter [Legionella saoudiensis]|uniref:transporter n=1 Tax=Legionella saoudiensis TaxID=1750561 RepID=UPI0007313F87|nr:transporter [Legionella saoudiensis]
MNRIFVVLLLIYSSTIRADCTTLLDLTNSPSKIDSACAVPFKKIIIESNYIYQNLYDSSGTQKNYPNAILRIGLPSNNELFVLPPNYIKQTRFPHRGVSITSLGLKHSFSYQENWLFALEEVVDLPSGSYYYGTAAWGENIKAIITSLITKKLTLSTMLGVSHSGDPAGFKGRTFYSFNPIVTLAYNPTEKISLYHELYAQSKISASEEWGINYDAGALFELRKNFIIYISWAHQLQHNLGNFKMYVSGGFSIML